MSQFIFFIHSKSGTNGRRLEEMISERMPGIYREIHPDIHSFEERLRRSGGNGEQVIYVVLADTQDRLSRLFKLAGYMNDKRLVLILPDCRKATWSKGFRMWPRYLTDANGNFDILCSVLGKMAG